ncbi:hypothetical protein BBP40_001417 [Aspergillus hancockii]|nr:hypothetical protein BBP40_001417 [Aspergillus hancockii]
MHPRLLTTVILLDPVIQITLPTRDLSANPPGAINYALWRPDKWPNRKAAASALAKIWRQWDHRCIDLMVRFGFRDLPTALYPELPEGTDSSDPPVTLTTTKYQEVLGLARANFSGRASDGRIRIDRSTHADIDPLSASQRVYRPEGRSTFYRLPSLRPSALWMLGAETFLCLDEMREGIRICGGGTGGSGGVSQGKVKEVTLPGRSHLFPFEDVRQTAKHCADWIANEMGNYQDLEQEWNKKRGLMSNRDHLVLGEAWFKAVNMPKAYLSSQQQSRMGKL